MRHKQIPAELFIDRRNEFMKKMKRGSIAIFYSNDPMPRNGDQFFPYRQDSVLFALSGIDQPGTILVLHPDSKNEKRKVIAFILPPDPDHAIWNGERLSATTAATISGVQTIRYTNQWDAVMKDIFNSCARIYVNTAEKVNATATIQSQNERMASILKTSFPGHAILSARPLLRTLMMIKHPMEIDLVKKAVEVTGIAFDSVLHHMYPGMREYELEAHITYALNANGCKHAFEPIVASGKSACILHYISNDNIIKPGTLILIDFGAEYANMASDITRTIPVNGKFSKDQKKIYLAVLHVLNEITNMMRPGITIDQLNIEAARLIESQLIGLKIISRTDVKNQNRKFPLWKKYFMHGISHHLGYDVHDLSDRSTPLRAGMLLTCEPGIYMPELKLGIRLENDILITRNKPVNLTASIPIDPDEIESIMNS